MHHGLGRAAVVHAHVQADELELVVEVLALGAPELLVLVALAQEAVRHECLVGLHAGGGRNIVALELADERVQHNAGLLARLAQDALGTVDEGVLVSAVERVAGLEGDRLLPALGLDEGAGLGRAHDAPGERAGVLGGGEADLAADQLGALVTEPELRARVVGALGAVDGLDEGGLVPGEAVADGQRAEGLAGLVDEGDLRAGGAGSRLRVGHGQDDRDRPGPVLAAALDAALAKDAVVVRLAHWTRERAQGAVGDAVEGRAVDLVDADRGQSLLDGGGIDAVDGRVEAPVDGRGDGGGGHGSCSGDGGVACGRRRIRGSRGS